MNNGQQGKDEKKRRRSNDKSATANNRPQQPLSTELQPQQSGALSPKEILKLIKMREADEAQKRNKQQQPPRTERDVEHSHSDQHTTPLETKHSASSSSPYLSEQQVLESVDPTNDESPPKTATTAAVSARNDGNGTASNKNSVEEASPYRSEQHVLEREKKHLKTDQSDKPSSIVANDTNDAPHQSAEERAMLKIIAMNAKGDVSQQERELQQYHNNNNNNKLPSSQAPLANTDSHEDASHTEATYYLSAEERAMRKIIAMKATGDVSQQEEELQKYNNNNNNNNNNNSNNSEPAANSSSQAPASTTNATTTGSNSTRRNRGRESMILNQATAATSSADEEEGVSLSQRVLAKIVAARTSNDEQADDEGERSLYPSALEAAQVDRDVEGSVMMQDIEGGGGEEEVDLGDEDLQGSTNNRERGQRHRRRARQGPPIPPGTNATLADSNNNDNTNSAFRRQKTPDAPGAFSREGLAISRRPRGALETRHSVRSFQSAGTNRSRGIGTRQGSAISMHSAASSIAATPLCEEENDNSGSNSNSNIGDPLRNSSVGVMNNTNGNFNDVSDLEFEGESAVMSMEFLGGRQRQVSTVREEQESIKMSTGLTASQVGRLGILTDEQRALILGEENELVEARPVTGDSFRVLADADSMDGSAIKNRQREMKQRFQRSRRNIFLGLFLALFVILAVVLGLFFGLSSKSETTAAPMTLTSSPTMAPTAVVISDLPDFTLNAIQIDPYGAQNQAYQWLLGDPNLANYSQKRRLQRFVLATLYYATRGESWEKKEGWLDYDTHECRWAFRSSQEELVRPCFSVDTASQSGEEKAEEDYENLLLYSNGLIGNLPPELFLLKSLRRIDMASNELYSSIPVFGLSANDNSNSQSAEPTHPTMSMPNLQILSITGNELTGTLPSTIGLWTALQGFYAGLNRFSGTIPSELSYMRSLVDVALDSNSFTGSIPQVGALSHLVLLSLFDNQLTGSLDNLMKPPPQTNTSDAILYSLDGLPPPSLTSLKELLLSGNSLSGSIPTSLVTLCPNATRVVLARNRLNNGLPSEIGALTLLKEFDVTSNSLSILQIPTEIGRLKHLTLLAVDANNALGGFLPSEIFALTGLSSLDLSIYGFAKGNSPMRLSGSLPTEVGKMSKLTALKFAGQRLVSTIPTEVGMLTKLQELWLLQNAVPGVQAMPGFYGPLPSELGLCTDMTSLGLYENSLSGTIPIEMKHLNLLQTIRLDTNYFQGHIPSDLTSKMTRLKELGLQRNFLSGTIPSEMFQPLAQLETLNLYSNRLAGPIPKSIGQLHALELLRLDNNYFSGSLPASIGNCSQLQTLVLTQNLLSGEFPREASNLKSLVILYAASNKFTSSLPSEFGLLHQLQILDFAVNFLTGTISTFFGQLQSLSQLFLYRNEFIGLIPSQLGQLKNVTEISAAQNNFTGIPSELGLLSAATSLFFSSNALNQTIPSELAQLTALQHLLLDNNALYGTISSTFGSLENLATLALEKNDLNGTLSTELGWLDQLENLLLGDNAISGELPSELGLLSSVVEVSCSRNKIQGAIPSQLGQLTSLQRLWLGENDFTGLIPSEIGYLSDTLTVLSLKNNSLERKLPTTLGSLSQLLLLELQSNRLTGRVPIEPGNLNNLMVALSDIRGNALSGTMPAGLCEKVSFDCSGRLCGCSCACVDTNISTTPNTSSTLAPIVSEAANASSANMSDAT